MSQNDLHPRTADSIPQMWQQLPPLMAKAKATDRERSFSRRRANGAVMHRAAWARDTPQTDDETNEAVCSRVAVLIGVQHQSTSLKGFRVCDTHHLGLVLHAQEVQAQLAVLHLQRRTVEHIPARRRQGFTREAWSDAASDTNAAEMLTSLSA